MAYTINWFNKRYLQEIGIFAAMFILTMVNQWFQLDSFNAIIKGLVFFVILYAQAKFHWHFILPLFWNRKYGTYAIVTFGALLIGTLVLFPVDCFWIEPGILQQESVMSVLLYHFVISIASISTIMFLFLIRQHASQIRKRTEDKLLLAEMNIRLLHAQLNPHFLFNMFNNLYGVSLAEPERVPDLILKLSNLIRYQLEDGRRPLVALQAEIAFIENYIAIEKERIGKRCEISYTVQQGDLEPDKLSIAPLILITLIENAFKHSITITRKWYVHINIQLEQRTLIVDIVNSLGDEALKRDSTGIGLATIRERLELLYAGNYQLDTFQHESEFRVVLKILLNHR
ncbi:histidine kinase [Chitinophaga ginsengisegetis]|uniref:sensor histidine kinase n=1 Tax=Chitinophaga ginsengisegetis TaxID=393003 RepID=UPI000DC007DC|nr:histidine kinase [Chitinophaga ginsengisegetis]MDR6565069.1 LytS/YehU family sensor histidine kinase [Chitinophaga ginsengisegetis]MDR6644796.1 LytS/YehU family sensor histidine kinase [Chitinophaga ginsengisegetis]MDR6652612.1 LytS/YehU family sensor histidine kinase [Chitinophaga ginsengisegetis]